jgi:hypothetical protein
MEVQVLQRMPSAKPGKSLIALAIALAIGGCSSGDDSPPAPVACKEGPDAVRAALARAPARVELDGTPLSECFTRGSSAADLQEVGASYVAVASGLADEARLRPDGPAALRLGYLVGAARRGASETQGVHEELMRRIEQELAGVDRRSPQYRRGYEAGRAHG